MVGVGLIGGSIGRALRERSLAGEVVGVGRNPETLLEAVRLGAIDRATTDLAVGVDGADVVVVCSPVHQIAALAVRSAAAAPHALVTDAGSTKRTIVESVEADARGRAAFVGAHPIAGSERSGAAHSDGNLFVGRACVLTPTRRTPPDRLARARSFWSALGCRLVETDPGAHDQSLALTSHLPHAVAAALAATVPAEALGLAAGAYRDGTRVAGADPALWSAIFRENRAPLLQALDRFEHELGAFREALLDDDPTPLLAWWAAARERRAGFTTGGKTPPTVGDDSPARPNEH